MYLILLTDAVAFYFYESLRCQKYLSRGQKEKIQHFALIVKWILINREPAFLLNILVMARSLIIQQLYYSRLLYPGLKPEKLN